MSKELAISDIETMAISVAKSGMFPDINTKEKAFTLMMLCQAEGLHPMQALKKYNIIQNRPAMKADAMLADFNQKGGIVEWLVYTDKEVKAKFTHPNKTSIIIQWTIEMAAKIKQYSRKKEAWESLTQKDNWRNYPRQMLKARVISEGIRAIMPEVCAGVYTVEEVQDFTEKIEKPKKTEALQAPQAKPVEHAPEASQLVKDFMNKPEPKKELDNKPEEATDAPQKPQERGEAPQATKTTTKPKTSKLAQINARLKELKETLGTKDFNSILETTGVDLKKGTSLKKAEELIALMEQYVVTPEVPE